MGLAAHSYPLSWVSMFWSGCRSCQVGTFEIFEIFEILSFFFCRATTWFRMDLSGGVAMQRIYLAPHLQNLQLKKKNPEPWQPLIPSYSLHHPKMWDHFLSRLTERQEGQKTPQELQGLLRLDLSRKWN